MNEGKKKKKRREEGDDAWRGVGHGHGHDDARRLGGVTRVTRALKRERGMRGRGGIEMK